MVEEVREGGYDCGGGRRGQWMTHSVSHCWEMERRRREGGKKIQGCRVMADKKGKEEGDGREWKGMEGNEFAQNRTQTLRNPKKKVY